MLTRTSIRVLFTLALLLTAASNIVAQPTTTTEKVALVDTRVFFDPKIGIQKLVRAQQQLETEFAPQQTALQALQNRIVVLNTEINKLGTSAAAQAKEEELIRLQRDFSNRQQEAEAAFNKRRLILMQPIQHHINKALQEFIAARGIGLLLDASKLEGAILAMLPTTDLTQAFILEYNSKNPASANTALR